MRIELNERNYQASEHLKRILDQKLSKLDKYFDEDANAKVVLKKEGSTLVTEVMLSYAGKLIRAEVASDNFYENIDKVLPKLEGQIRKHRTKFDKHSKNTAYKESALYAVNDLPSEKQSKIVKEKKFKVTPLTDDEAVVEMELLGHDFFVYKDIKTLAVKVVYLRNDGEYGIISTEE
ncbi:MAG: ribosome-associated translation inhibitor RaiA [Clostridia bacterium]|nr:ribosome-associated translation inhibitor RaiA [Clostridia bacterium]